MRSSRDFLGRKAHFRPQTPRYHISAALKACAGAWEYALEVLNLLDLAVVPNVICPWGLSSAPTECPEALTQRCTPSRRAADGHWPCGSLPERLSSEEKHLKAPALGC